MKDIDFMSEAFELAEEALEKGEVPVGCVFVKNGRIIERSYNDTNASGDASRHCEMVAISRMKLRTLHDVQLYVTVEPCIMCAAALGIMKIGHVYFGCANDRFGGCGSTYDVHKVLNHEYSCTGGILKDRAIALLKEFYARGNPNAPEDKRARKLRE